MESDAMNDPTGSLAGGIETVIEALRTAPAIAAFIGAETRFQSDAELMRMRAGLQMSFDAFQRANAKGAARQAMLTEVRERQARVQAHPLVQEYLTTKSRAEAFLRQINGVISSIVGLDLADAGRPAGGCC
jgi:cell fate (sporulation/competence/biofilm development) regulator YlbF (YheA/YmcA/DUF963 family)